MFDKSSKNGWETTVSPIHMCWSEVSHIHILPSKLPTSWICDSQNLDGPERVHRCSLRKRKTVKAAANESALVFVVPRHSVRLRSSINRNQLKTRFANLIKGITLRCIVAPRQTIITSSSKVFIWVCFCCCCAYTELSFPPTILWLSFRIGLMSTQKIRQS